MDRILPNETLSHILTHLRSEQQTLGQLIRTCKKLCDLTAPHLYKAPNFNSLIQFTKFAQNLTDRNGAHVKHIDLHMVPHRWESQTINPLLYSLTPKTPELESLNLDLCSELTNKALARITEPLHDLRLLSVDQCELINDEAINALAENCPYIQDLYLGSTQITDKSLCLLASHFILLTHLHIPNCERVTETGINKLIDERPTLKYLNIKDCYNVIGIDSLPQADEQRASQATIGSEDDDQWTDLDEDEPSEL